MSEFPHVGTLDNSYTFELVKDNVIQSSKGGVITRFNTSTQPFRRKYSVQFNIQGLSRYQEINGFLGSRNGVAPFTYKGTQYRCEQWDWIYHPNSIYSLKATFIETRRFRFI